MKIKIHDKTSMPSRNVLPRNREQAHRVMNLEPCFAVSHCL